MTLDMSQHSFGGYRHNMIYLMMCLLNLPNRIYLDMLFYFYQKKENKTLMSSSGFKPSQFFNH